MSLDGALFSEDNKLFLLNLLEKDPEEIIFEIRKKLEKNPHFLEERFENGCTFFHVVINLFSNKTLISDLDYRRPKKHIGNIKLVHALCTIPEFEKLAWTGNQEGQSILHYTVAMQEQEGTELLNYLLGKFGFKLNFIDGGEKTITPLELAKERYPWAVPLLNRAKEEEEKRIIQKSKIKTTMHANSSNTSKTHSLLNRIRSFSLSSSSSSSSSSMIMSPPTPKMKDHDLLEISDYLALETLNSQLREGNLIAAEEYISNLLEQPIKKTFNTTLLDPKPLKKLKKILQLLNSTTQDKAELSFFIQSSFFLFCNDSDKKAKDSLITFLSHIWLPDFTHDETLALSNAKNLLIRVNDALKHKAKKLRTTMYASLNSSEDYFEDVLVTLGLFNLPNQSPTFPGHLPKELEAIWYACSFKIQDDEHFLFERANFTHRTLGLIIDNQSYEKIFESLILLFPYFNRHQKLAAYFLTKTLVLIKKEEPNLEKTLTVFFNTNLLHQEGKPSDILTIQEGKKLSGIINNITAIKKLYDQHPIIINKIKLGKLILNISYSSPKKDDISTKKPHSFDEDFYSSLKTGVTQDKDITFTANEFRTSTIKSYQEARPEDFLNSISKDALEYKLILRYLVKTILPQFYDNESNAVSFLIKLMHALQTPDTETETGIDYNSLQQLSAALDSPYITRLKKISKEDKIELEKISQEIIHLNFDSVSKAEKTPLYPFSTLSKFLTHAYENQDPLNKIEAIGKIYAYILKIQELVALEDISFETDFYQMLSKMDLENPNEDKFDTMCALTSWSISSPVIDFNRSLFDDGCIQLEQIYIPKQYLPILKIGNNSYAPTDPKWLKSLRELSSQIEYKNADDHRDFEKRFDQLISKATDIIQKKYNPNIKKLSLLPRLNLEKKEGAPLIKDSLDIIELNSPPPLIRPSLISFSFSSSSSSSSTSSFSPGFSPSSNTHSSSSPNPTPSGSSSAPLRRTPSFTMLKQHVRKTESANKLGKSQLSHDLSHDFSESSQDSIDTNSGTLPKKKPNG